MHQILSEKLNIKQTDHKDRNKLNNQKENLRESTFVQNSTNKTKRNGTSSKYKGIYWNKETQKWRGETTIDNIKQHLGYFDNEKDAALEYNIYAIKYFGEFAVLNNIEE
jgi:hypothetical protein